jgi:hypothetical protein
VRKDRLKESLRFGDLPWCVMCRSPYKTSIILEAMRTGRDWPVMSATWKLPSDRAMHDRGSRLTVQEILKQGEYCAIA